MTAIEKEYSTEEAQLAAMSVNWVGTPGHHQIRGVGLGLLRNEFAYFWEPGTGKTYTTIHVAKTRYERGEIDLVVIMLPNAIKQVWEREVPAWAPDIPTYVQTLDSGKKPKRKPGQHLEFLVIAIEALSQGSMYDTIMAYMKGRKVMVIEDESSRIKNPSSIRTKKATNIAWSGFYRYILTGTPITQGPHDLFPQFRFLNPNIIGIIKWAAFKARYCIMGGFENRKIVKYQHIEELVDKIKPYCDMVLLKDCTDIPEKIYSVISVPLSPEQRAAIRQLKDEGTLVIEELQAELYVEMALERMTRIQQIVGGSLPMIDQENGGYKTVAMPGKCPKMEALLDYVEDLPETTKCLVWARFEPERERLCAALAAIYGESSVVRFDGSVNKEDRRIAVDRIQDDPTCRFFVGNQTVAGIGLTLTAAKYALNFSNTFSAEDRVQMENRNHRTGQTDHCVYVDFVAQVKEDRMILRSVELKKDIAAMVSDSVRKGRGYEEDPDLE